MSILYPAEWAPHRAIWVGFPSGEACGRTTSSPPRTRWPRWPAPWPSRAASACGCWSAATRRSRRRRRGSTAAPASRIVRGLFGDIWLRDTAAIFVQQGDKTLPAGFKFNGWGSKYVLDYDDQVAEQIAAASSAPPGRARLHPGGRGARHRRLRHLPDHAASACSTAPPQPRLDRGDRLVPAVKGSLPTHKQLSSPGCRPAARPPHPTIGRTSTVPRRDQIVLRRPGQVEQW